MARTASIQTAVAGVAGSSVGTLLVSDSVTADYVELAGLGYVTRSRMSQIMSLLNLTPDIQEALLFLPRVERGKDPVTERELRAVDWGLLRARRRAAIAVVGASRNPAFV